MCVAGKTGGAFGFALIFLFLFQSREKEKQLVWTKQNPVI
jgi:hypothetical protein